MNYDYCCHCGRKTTIIEIEGRKRAYCENCDLVLYQNPIPSVAILAINEKNEILLTQRAVEPGKGYWCLPGGFIELGESAEEAVIRELKEETNLDCDHIRLLTADSVIKGYWGDILILGYSVTLTSSEVIPGDDAEAARFFDLRNRPDLIFPVHENLLNKFLSVSK